MKTQPTILVSAYAVHPTKGSEDGMGWNFVLQIAKRFPVICVTRKNNKPAIDKYISSVNDSRFNRITFLYFDLPYFLRFWKKKNRGALIYYWMWQFALPRFIKQQNIKFDVVHNLNFHNDWTPSYLWKLNKPFVWGPIGHHPEIPHQYRKPHGSKFVLKNKLTWWVKNVMWKWSGALHRTIEKADFIYAMNSSVGENIKLTTKKHFVRPSVASQDHGYYQQAKSGGFRIISAGRLVPLKGFDLGIRSFARFLDLIPPNERKLCSLTIVGSGQEITHLKEDIQRLDIASHVTLIPWLERDELLKIMKEASMFLFPSHEGAGMVVAEALSFALPVVCLDNCGPGELIDRECGFAIPKQSYDSTVEQLANATYTLFSNHTLYHSMRHAARKRFTELFDWDRRGEWLEEVYLSVV
ncbi:MAG: glycosyltransferase [Bacteroidia bacterium]|nr:glycosyltransferase [Bacteroidia bacterium]